jgi:Ca2+-binding EF-hand superfamily protein
MKTKSLMALAALSSLLALPAFAQMAAGGAGAGSAGWWGQELAAAPGLSDGLNVMDDLENNEAQRLSDTHWELTHGMVDLNGDGNVSRNELMGMLEGGKLRNSAAAPNGLIDVSVADVAGQGAARMAEGVAVSSDPQGFEAVTLEQGVNAVSATVGGGQAAAFVGNPLSTLAEHEEARFLRADQNGDRAVDLQELVQLRRALMQAGGNETTGNDNRLRKQARRIIGRIDTNGDQMVTREELAAARGNRMMQRLDTNGDGQISPAEWAVTLQ